MRSRKSFGGLGMKVLVSRPISRWGDVMTIIALLGGLVLGGAAFAVLRRMGQSSKSHNKELHIV